MQAMIILSMSLAIQGRHVILYPPVDPTPEGYQALRDMMGEVITDGNGEIIYVLKSNDMPQLTFTTAQVQAILETNQAQYTLKTDPDTGLHFRIGIRDSQCVTDKELTQTGFAGMEGVDWENIFATV